jgi:hypothetical protein
MIYSQPIFIVQRDNRVYFTKYLVFILLTLILYLASCRQCDSIKKTDLKEKGGYLLYITRNLNT